MAYTYLLDFYKHIENRLNDARTELAKVTANAPAGRFEQGRIDVLSDFQNYLKENFNSKLPRRIRESLGRKNHES